jgi:hypothetical protein
MQTSFSDPVFIVVSNHISFVSRITHHWRYRLHNNLDGSLLLQLSASLPDAVVRALMEGSDRFSAFRSSLAEVTPFLASINSLHCARTISMGLVDDVGLWIL